MDFSVFAEASAWVSLLTLTLLEIVLGIDNIVFISILSSKLPKDKQSFARKLGLGVALFARVALLFAISWLLTLQNELFSWDVLGLEFSPSGKDLILLFGGLFLLGKASHEIFENVERPHEHHLEDIEASGKVKAVSMQSFVIQVVMLDVVFSLDSVITAAGLVEHISIMVVAVIIAVIVMMIFANPISNFVEKHAAIKVLALSFLVLIGVLLMAESFGQHVSKGYVYFAMAFALVIQLLNIRMESRLDRMVRQSGTHEAIEKQ